ncbi:hypothetical protein ACIBKZ_08955 [Streptomyces sp. NPDC050421]|uniref:hypothetical protein n=1 Tax=Streptomyces sp. NPDC050421 TaxID=3365613 RepID=UPI00378A69DD
MTVIGASDGRLVVPLAEAGYRVIAIERDPIALHGGEVQLPDDEIGHAVGLIDRLKREGLYERVQVVEDDFLAAEPPPRVVTPSGRVARGITVPTTTSR